MLKEMEKREFADGIKGCVDISPGIIEGCFDEVLVSHGYSTEIERAWIHFMAPGSDHAAGHTHAHDTAVYYLQTYPDSGDLKFNDEGTILHPEDNQFVFVPALENHSMTKNNSSGIRLAMAFPIKKRITPSQSY